MNIQDLVSKKIGRRRKWRNEDSYLRNVWYPCSFFLDGRCNQMKGLDLRNQFAIPNNFEIKSSVILTTTWIGRIWTASSSTTTSDTACVVWFWIGSRRRGKTKGNELFRSRNEERWWRENKTLFVDSKSEDSSQLQEQRRQRMMMKMTILCTTVLSYCIISNAWQRKLLTRREKVE